MAGNSLEPQHSMPVHNFPVTRARAHFILKLLRNFAALVQPIVFEQGRYVQGYDGGIRDLIHLHSSLRIISKYVKVRLIVKI